MKRAFRSTLSVLAAASVLAACDAMLVSPAPAPTGLAIRYSIAAASPASAFDKADNAVVTVAIAGEKTVQKTFEFPAGQQEIRVRMELDLSQEQANAEVTLQLRAGTQTIFTGVRTVLLTEGEKNEADVVIAPVAAAIAVPQTVTLTALKQEVQLQGFALFATGDTIGPVTLVWSTTSPDLQLTADGRLTALQNGTYSLTARSGDLTATATVVVAAPATALAFTGTAAATVFPGDSIIPPPVRVTDATGTPLRGVAVTFTANNGGTVRGATATTNAQGLAQATSWLIGNTGTNTLTASVPGVTAASISVTPMDPCTREQTLAPNSVTNGELVVGRDCQPSAGGRVSDRYNFTLATPTVLRAQLQSSAFAPFVVTGVPGTPSGYQIGGRLLSTPGTVTSEHVLPAGTYFVNATTQAANVGGAYTLTLSTDTEPQRDCGARTGDAAVTWGSVASGNLTTGDCIDEFDPDTTLTRRFDGYSILLRAGESVTVSVVANFPYRFARWEGGSFADIRENVPAGQSTGFTVTASTTAFHGFYVITQHENGTGSYTVTFSGGSGPTGQIISGDAETLTHSKQRQR